MRPEMLTIPTLSRIIRPVQSGIWAMNALKPRKGVVRSCTAVSESFDAFNRLAAALAKSQDRRASSRGFPFGADRQGALANGAEISRTQERQRRGKPNRGEPALIERPAQAWLNVTHRSSHPEESIRQAHLVWEGQMNPPDGADRELPVTRWRYAQ